MEAAQLPDRCIEQIGSKENQSGIRYAMRPYYNLGYRRLFKLPVVCNSNCAECWRNIILAKPSVSPRINIGLPFRCDFTFMENGVEMHCRQMLAAFNAACS